MDIVLIGLVALLLHLGHLVGLEAEEEDVLVPQHLVHLHVGAVQGADGHRAVHHELHIAGAAGLLAGGGDLLGELAGGGNGIYVRVDNTNGAQKAISQEINKMAKADVETQVYTEFNEQFQAVAWIILLLLLAEMLILERKNPLFRNIHLFSNKK